MRYSAAGRGGGRPLARREALPAARRRVRRHAAERRGDLGPAARVRRGGRCRARRGGGHPARGGGSRRGVEPRRRHVAPGAHRVPDPLRLRRAADHRDRAKASCAPSDSARSPSSLLPIVVDIVWSSGSDVLDDDPGGIVFVVGLVFGLVFVVVGAVLVVAPRRRPGPARARCPRRPRRDRSGHRRGREAPRRPPTVATEQTFRWFAVDPGDVDEVDRGPAGRRRRLPAARGSTVRVVVTPAAARTCVVGRERRQA